MAINLSLTEALKESELMMSDVVGVNDPANYEKDLGFLQYLFSEGNKKTINTTLGNSANQGKYRPVEIRYTPKKGQGDLSEAVTGYSCTKGTTRREIIETKNPALFAIDQFTIDEQITREGTQLSFNERVAKEIKDSMLNLRENIDKQLAIIYDSVILVVPTIEEPILEGSIHITGKYKIDEIEDIVHALNTSSLLASYEVSEIEPLSKELWAGKK